MKYESILKYNDSFFVIILVFDNHKKYNYLPKSKRLSKMLTCLGSLELIKSGCIPGSPGCIKRTRQMPKMALNKEVETKYNNVRKAIRPFILAFKLADPDIKLAITKGRIINLRTRINSSPGYDINIIDSASRWAGRRPKPGKK